MLGGVHSNKVGYGLLDIPIKHRSWILLNWQVKILQRPKYGETLRVKTWSCKMEKLYAIRDYEIYNEKNEKVVIATSKWVCVDTEKKSIIRIEDDIRNAYTVEDKKVFDEEIKKIEEPSNYIDECIVKVSKDQIDVNGHVHNLNYIDYASQVLPYETMQKATSIEVMYKKEIKENDIIKCLYAMQDDASYVTIKSEDEKVLHAIIRLK